MSDELMLFPPHIEATVTRAYKAPKRGLYAAPPGTGPADETCGSCEHIMRTAHYRKCKRVRALWTGGLGTDIKARSPACSKWEAVAAVEVEGQVRSAKRGATP